jgi:hypothetical protein
MTGSSHNRRFVARAGAEKQRLAIAVFLVGLAGCGNKSDEKKPEPGSAAPPAPTAPGAPVSPEYAADIEKLCDVVKRSGAEKHEPNDRMYLIATWLGANLTTAEARKFLATIQPLRGNAKADALEAEGKRVGLAGCALAAEWRK